MKTTNYLELRNNLKSYLDRVINDNELLIIYHSGDESVVVISLEEYNSIKETNYIMKPPAITIFYYTKKAAFIQAISLSY